MITIHHNFDETKFKWLWARYVKAGNIDKHCVNSIPGAYSKKFSGASNHDLLSQPTLVMDEVEEGKYEAIYFCGVLKAGYLHKDPLKNNYPHNVHFAVRPEEGAKDVYDFENWHVEIEGGKLECIPATYELTEMFYNPAKYTSHFYTCRIFRWMVGHFFPQTLQSPYAALSETNTDGVCAKVEVDRLIKRGFDYAKEIFENEVENDDNIWMTMAKELSAQSIIFIGSNKVAKIRKYMFEKNLCQRNEIRSMIIEKLSRSGIDPCDDFEFKERYYHPEVFFYIGIDEYLETVLTYQDRQYIAIPEII